MMFWLIGRLRLKVFLAEIILAPITCAAGILSDLSTEGKYRGKYFEAKILPPNMISRS
jgi:hypothetical protein